MPRYTLHPFDPTFDAKQHNRYTVDKARWEEQVMIMMTMLMPMMSMVMMMPMVSMVMLMMMIKGAYRESRGAGGDGGLEAAQGGACRGAQGSQVVMVVVVVVVVVRMVMVVVGIMVMVMVVVSLPSDEGWSCHTSC